MLVIVTRTFTNFFLPLVLVRVGMYTVWVTLLQTGFGFAFVQKDHGQRS